MPAAKKKPKRKSPAWGEADYAAAGMGRITVRMPLSAHALLEMGAKAAGMGRSEYIAMMLKNHSFEHHTPTELFAKAPPPAKKAKKTVR